MLPLVRKATPERRNRPNHQSAEMCWIGPLFFFASAARRFFTAMWLFWFWMSDIDIMPFVSHSILKIFEVRKLFLPFFIDIIQVLARQPKLSNLVQSNLPNAASIFVSWLNQACCLEENFELFWCGVMECCLYIIRFFDVPYIIKWHSVVSLMTSPKFLIK